MPSAQPAFGLVAAVLQYLFTFTPPGRCDQRPVLAIRREHTRDGFAPLLLTLRVKRAVALACAMVTGEVDSWSGYQSDQSGNEIQRFENDLSRAVSPGCFQLRNPARFAA